MQRRTFLLGALHAGLWLPLASNRITARVLTSPALAEHIPTNDRVLVMINLNGGNDGLNTVIPFNDQLYYDARPTLALNKQQIFPITSDLGFHSSMPEFQHLFDNGECAIVQSVGYPGQDRSHFRSTDIWHSAIVAEESPSTGWTGRFIEAEHPEYPATLPESPFAIQVSSNTALLIQGEHGGTGMALQSPREFYDLANGQQISQDILPATRAGNHLAYIRQLMIESDKYSQSIARAIDRSTTQAEYADDSLSAQLRMIARLINGGLETGIYVVTLSGFDTHYDQAGPHSQLLQALSKAISSFMEDISIAGNRDRVVCLTYSEFGRRLSENGSAGTDHGAAAPQFVIGSRVHGGAVIGGIPDLQDLDSRGDVKWRIDFRQMYASILEDWLGFDHARTVALLGGEFNKLPLFDKPLDSVDQPTAYEHKQLALLASSPNPARDHTTITFVLPDQGHTRLNLYTIDGLLMLSGTNDILSAGRHELRLNVSSLPADDYICMLEYGGLRRSSLLTIMR